MLPGTRVDRDATMTVEKLLTGLEGREGLSLHLRPAYKARPIAYTLIRRRVRGSAYVVYSKDI